MKTKIVIETMSRRRTWTTEENDRLKQAVKDYGEHDWANIGRALGIDRRACRVHWTDAIAKLNRSLWTEDEERELIWLVQEKKTDKIPWSFIARTLGTGRTGKQCQYKYAAITKKKEESEEVVEPTKILLNPVQPNPDSDRSEEDWDERSHWLFGTL
jgi:hypothetical protein